MAELSSTRIVELTVRIVSSYLGNNAVPQSHIVDLITSTHKALEELRAPDQMAKPEQLPAVPVRKSITPDAIVCLEDGRPFRSLKRHLQTKYGMTADQYREKWGLPADYPMVAANYSAKRSALAKAIGLGRAPEKAQRRTRSAARSRQRPEQLTATGREGTIGTRELE